jgi:hypothetical protein
MLKKPNKGEFSVILNGIREWFHAGCPSVIDRAEVSASSSWFSVV